MNRPNKRAIAQAIYVTSHGYPARYLLKVAREVNGVVAPIFAYSYLDGTEIGTLAAANAIVRAIREHVEKEWRKLYADHRQMIRVYNAKKA